MTHKARWLPQFSIRTLLVVVALAGVTLATTVSASERVLLVVRLVSGVAIPVAILLAIYLRGSWRAFWTGFSVVGVWSYFFLFTEVGAGYLVWNPFRSAFETCVGSAVADLHSDWVATRSEEVAQSLWNGRQDDVIKARIAADMPKITRDVRSSVAGHAFSIAQYAFQLWISALGGLFACLLEHRRERCGPAQCATELP